MLPLLPLLALLRAQSGAPPSPDAPADRPAPAAVPAEVPPEEPSAPPRKASEPAAPSPERPPPPAAEETGGAGPPAEARPARSLPLPARPAGGGATAAAAPAPPGPAKAAPAPKGPGRAPERVEVAAAALRFAQALASRRATEVAGLCAQNFSFDGHTTSGAEGVRARWQEILGSREGGPEALLDLAVLPASEAQARLGKPPRRIAPLVTGASWVAVANLSGRPVVIVFGRQGGGWVATGIDG
ncbi:MAG TPA: hypothetical protein VMK42_15270 [Anaeromyxobacteraceae bacterium]|nr:hypothetical protein [Anaeromyxobacteraceae bacterium]